MAVSGTLVEVERRGEGLYPPGWADRLTDWVDSLRIPPWAFYLLVWLALFSIETGLNWYAGVYPVGTFFPYHAIFAGLAIYGLAVIHYLDRVAGDSLDAFRPALTEDDAGYARLRHELTTIPPRASVVATLVGICSGVLLVAYLADARTLSLIKLIDSTPSAVFNFALLFLIWCLQGLYFYHTWRQLYLVHRIYATSTHVDLFRRQPLYAFSGLSARTAASWAVIPYAGILSRPGVTENIAIVWVAILMTIMSLTIFAWPLWGIHRLMEAEKRRLLDENGAQLAAAIAETHNRMKSHDLKEMTGLKDAFDNLVSEQAVISKISTWPWQTGTVGVLATALLLPVILWVIEHILERFFTF